MISAPLSVFYVLYVIVKRRITVRADILREISARRADDRPAGRTGEQRHSRKTVFTNFAFFHNNTSPFK